MCSARLQQLGTDEKGITCTVVFSCKKKERKKGLHEVLMYLDRPSDKLAERARLREAVRS